MASLIDWVGTGTWLTVSVLYLSRHVGLTAEQIGVGLTGSGLVGLAAVVPVTSAARVVPARRLYAGLHVLRGLAMLGFLLVDGFAAFLLLASIVAVGDRPAAAVSQVLVARALPEQRWQEVMAMLHVTVNVGISIGAGLGSLALWIGSPAAYTAVIVANALSCLAAALGIAALPRSAADRTADTDMGAGAARKPIRQLAHDRRFVGAAAAVGVLALHIPVLNVVVPLWLAERTELPLAFVGPLFLMNTLLVVAVQMPVSKRVRTLPRGVRAAAVSATALAGSLGCLVAAGAMSSRTGPAAALLVAAVILVSVAEICHGAASWSLSLGLAPRDHRQPAYLGFFTLGTATAAVLGPALLTALLRYDATGWAVLGAILLGSVALLLCTTARGRPRSAQ